MHDRDLYAKLLGIETPWFVREVEARLDVREVEVLISYGETAEATCPVCGVVCGRYDSRTRTWRHLDTMQYRTLLTADVPRVKRVEHGVKQVKVPWAEPGSRFTAMFEALVIDWLQEGSTSAVARCSAARDVLGRGARGHGPRSCSWAAASDVAAAASDRYRRDVLPAPSRVRHGRLRHRAHACGGSARRALSGGSGDVLLGHAVRGPPDARVGLDGYVGPDIQATREHVPDADEKIGFDRFHVAKHIGDGVNKVRVEENSELLGRGIDTLKGTRYLWLQNPENMKPHNRSRFEELRDTAVRVARAWAMKDTARHLWSYKARGWARRAWNGLIDWMAGSGLQPMVKVSRMLREHLWGIINAIVLGVTNAHLEAVNAKIQALKKRACGYRNRARFLDAILFHCGDLDLYPQLASAHTKA